MQRKTRLLVALTTLLVCSGWVGATEYTLQTSGRWLVAGNWDPGGGPPGSADVAIIPTGKTCFLADGDTEDAGAIVVAGGGVIELRDQSTLTLHGTQNSVVDGRVVFTYTGTPPDDCAPGNTPGILHIHDDLTITGEGGVIVGGCQKSDRNDGVISGESGAVLTLQNGQEGGLTVMGMLDIQVELVNNAEVSAGYEDDPPPEYVHDEGGTYVLRLTDEPKSGSGVWSAFVGTLQVDTPVQSDGCWRTSIDRGTSPILIINAACLGQGAEVSFQGGVIDINADFCASADFVLGNVPDAVSGWNMTLEVAAGKTFVVGASCDAP